MTDISNEEKYQREDIEQMNPRDYSVLRREQYRHLFKIVFEGDILDLGGDIRNNYHKDLKGSHKIDIANLDPHSGAKLIFDFTKRFPLEDSSYDHILCLNVLEHVFEFDTVLRESNRILKKGCQITLSTPFMYRVHGAPDDYFRYTASSLKKILKESGFVEVKITPLSPGIFSVFAQHVSGMVPTIFLRNIFRKTMSLLDRACIKIVPRYKDFADQTTVGYFVTARKS